MIDINEKKITERIAHAQVYVSIPSALGSLLKNDNFSSPKGPVFHTAIIAGTLAAKNTSQLIPFCHNLALSSIKIIINLETQSLIKISCHTKTQGQTGVEMEALTGASVAALAIYDMCKSYSTEIEISNLRLVQKSGGKRDYQWSGARGGPKFPDERS